ncbi:MAG: hypothetical protein GY796_31870 [Chloroflexi bacterium]|nr:hypothetical protein [Chloroflexota bacterium]
MNMLEQESPLKAIYIKTYYIYGLLILMILINSYLSVQWVVHDTRPQPFFDPYATKTLIFIDIMRESGIPQIIQALDKMSVGSRPPLYQLLTIPSILFIERSSDAMLFSNIFANAILAVSVFQLGKLAKNNETGLLAALIVLTYPTISNLAKMTRPHAIVPAVTAVSLWLLFSLLKNRSEKIAWLVGLSLAVAFWVHPNLLYVLPLATCVVSIYLIFFLPTLDFPSDHRKTFSWFYTKLSDPFVLKGLVLAVVIALILTALWYLPHIDPLTNLIKESASAWSLVSYGFRNVPPTFWWYAQTLPGTISNFFTVLLALGLVVGFIKRKLFPVMMSLVFILMYIGIGLRAGTLAWMNGAVILPLAAIITAAFITDLIEYLPSTIKKISRNNPISIVGIRLINSILLTLVFFFAILNYSIVNWGIPSVSDPIANMLGIPLKSACGWRMVIAYCPDSPHDEVWQIEMILETVLDQCQHIDCQLALVTDHVVTISHSGLEYHLVRAYPATNLTIYSAVFRGEKNISWLISDYLFYIPQLENNEYSTAIKALLEENLENDDSDYEVIKRFVLPRNWTGILLKRKSPLEYDEAVQTINQLEITPEIKEQLLEDVAMEFLQ